MNDPCCQYGHKINTTIFTPKMNTRPIHMEWMDPAARVDTRIAFHFVTKAVFLRYLTERTSHGRQ